MLFCYPDPFGGDPFKGTDPFAADNFFKQSSVGFPSGDPFSSSDPFSATTGPKESDPFTSRASNAVTPDPFASSSGNIQDADPFGSKMDALTDADPFSSTGTGHDPFGGSNIPAVSAVKRETLFKISLKTNSHQYMLTNSNRQFFAFCQISVIPLSVSVGVGRHLIDANVFIQHLSGQGMSEKWHTVIW